MPLDIIIIIIMIIFNINSSVFIAKTCSKNILMKILTTVEEFFNIAPFISV